MIIKNINQVAGSLAIRDPFIMGAYHYDLYPEGNGKLGPKASLAGRKIGQDFDRNNPWRMYHGQNIPGFPHHPHRGFEIITIVAEGYADHFDSKGSKGRYGEGDVQLMSAGEGVLHAEMFPLIHEDKPNHLRLFQIWVNLPGKSKLTSPDYKMLWSEQIPKAQLTQSDGKQVDIQVILGQYAGVKSLEPLKHSWAKDENHQMGVALVTMDPNTEFKLEARTKSMNRFIFFYEGTDQIRIDEHSIASNQLIDLAGDMEIMIRNGDGKAKLLILEGEPINEPVAAYGPFVMNTEKELQEAFAAYRKTEFGGWPWGNQESDLVHAKNAGRFASYDFGKVIDKP